MRRFIRRWAIGLGVLALVIASAHSVSANTWSSTAVNTNQPGNAITINTNFPNAGNTGSGGGSIGTTGEQFSTTFYGSGTSAGTAGTAFRTFCVDLSSYLQTGTYNVPVTITSGTNTDYLGNAQNIGAAGWVVNTYGNYTNTQLGVVGGVTGVTGAQANTALQMAVWEAAYDPTATQVNNSLNSLYFTGSAGTDWNNEVAIANAILAARGSQTSAVGFIQYETYGGTQYSQDMIFAVPEPSALAIAGLGMLGFVGYGLRRKRS